jgi:hypothetical protein
VLSRGSVSGVRSGIRIVSAGLSRSDFVFCSGGRLRCRRDCSGAQVVLLFCMWAMRWEVCVMLSVCGAVLYRSRLRLLFGVWERLSVCCPFLVFVCVVDMYN